MGDTREDIYDIGQPFRITFKEDEWTRAIEKLPNGAIVVAVELRRDETEILAPATSVSGDSCPGAVPQLVEVGERVKVCTWSDNLIIRDEPGPNGSEMFRMAPGTRLVVIGEPTCSDNSSWWQVEVPGGILVRRGSFDAPLYQLETDTIGWLREGSDAIDRYYICSIP